jgi:hypothetical protein
MPPPGIVGLTVARLCGPRLNHPSLDRAVAGPAGTFYPVAQLLPFACYGAQSHQILGIGFRSQLTGSARPCTVDVWQTTPKAAELDGVREPSPR